MTDQTSRPAAPESETPETDAVETRWVKLGCYEGYGWTFARSLERRLSLAQTEIKGHMRVAKEVRDDALEEAAKVAEPRSNNPETDWERGYWAAENVISKTIRELKSRA